MSTSSLPPENSRGIALGKELAQAARFWEPLRIAYNVALAGVVGAWVMATWPHFRLAMKLTTLVPMVFLALLANVCYSAAYLVELPLQQTPRTWMRHCRWAVWTAGTLFAIALANYWIADEIFPDVH